MTHSRQVRCECGWHGGDEEIATLCIDPGSREEPPEYAGFCPSCGGAAEDCVEDVPLCESCNDVCVKDENDTCPECHGAMMEDAYDARKDNCLSIATNN